MNDYSTATFVIKKSVFDTVMTMFFRNAGFLSSTHAMEVENLVMDDEMVEITAEVTGESIQ